MRLRAQITVDIEVRDFAEAASHQKEVENMFGLVKARYEQAVLEFRQRRERVRRQPNDERLRHYTGNMSEYE
jgi:hypothetical protein